MSKELGLPSHRNDDYVEELSAAYQDIPQPLRSYNEVTADVMSKLIDEKDKLRKTRFMTTQSKLFTRVAVMFVLFVLVGGTCYAAYTDFRLSLHDKSGNETFRVTSTDVEALDSAAVGRIIEHIRDRLKDGEQAKVDIDWQGKYGPASQDSSIYFIVKPRDFDSPELMNEYLSALGIDMGLPLKKWNRWKLYKTELQNNNVSSYESRWFSAYDKQSGLNYQYATGKSGTTPTVLRWLYSNQKHEINLQVYLGITIVPTLSDNHLSSDSILKLHGVDAYLMQDNEGLSIHWSEQVADGSYRYYTAYTQTATENELRKFSAAFISHQQS
ncbi:hypothetical protein [Paenibacillus silvisoli]|uniref:hypothetical protein n=1 Tax=Paenibacillus silvisoli TaxID=3110539 RepID=UPI002804A2C4|nr:hypothetical protein [Paenibacillus silvisoli]